MGFLRFLFLCLLICFPFFPCGLFLSFFISGKLDDVVLGYDSIQEYQVRLFFFHTACFSCFEPYFSNGYSDFKFSTSTSDSGFLFGL